MEDTGRDQVEDILLVSDADSVARIRASLVARNDVDLLGEHVDNLSLPLVPPLGADDDLNWHGGLILQVQKN